MDELEHERKMSTKFPQKWAFDDETNDDDFDGFIDLFMQQYHPKLKYKHLHHAVIAPPAVPRGILLLEIPKHWVKRIYIEVTEK